MLIKCLSIVDSTLLRPSSVDKVQTDSITFKLWEAVQFCFRSYTSRPTFAHLHERVYCKSQNMAVFTW